jgi:hypothetical protein
MVDHAAFVAEQKPQGAAVDDRRVIHGILWRFSNRQPVDGRAGVLWTLHHLPQAVRSMAESRGLGWDTRGSRKLSTANSR